LKRNGEENRAGKAKEKGERVGGNQEGEVLHDDSVLNQYRWTTAKTYSNGKKRGREGERNLSCVKKDA